MSETPTVIDLFAGVGGLSLGAARAGFRVLAAVENDPIALASHAKNFPAVKHFSDDISKLKGADLLARIGIEKGELTGLIGGPPCQGFSNIGKRKEDDSRNYLFGHFFRLVDEIRPAFFVAENVPGIRNPKYDRMREDAFAKVPDCYELFDPIVVRASSYGAPTTRTRIFFIGYDPTKLASLSPSDFAPPEDVETITVKDALQGLPSEILDDWQSKDAEWGYVVKSNGSHYMTRIVGEIPSGVGDELAIREYEESSLTSGCQGTRHVAEVVERFSKLEQGQTDSVSRAMRLNLSGFCPTLRAGTARDKGSYQAIRPVHPTEPRVITPREAARLQGFPDWFVFHPTKWHSFRQIGNSVSPLVGEYLLSIIKKTLKART